MRLFVICLGTVLIGAGLFDGFNTIVLPRRMRHAARFSTAFYVWTWSLYAGIARRIRNGGKREAFLSVYGPMSLLGLLVCWTVTIVAGFALLQWAIPRPNAPGSASFADSLYTSASSLVTIASTEPANRISKWLDTLEAGLGLATLGLVVGYLPVLYQSYSSRELRISMLDARAGSPPSAGELLIRQSSNTDSLREQLVVWEEWTAELLQENLSYPMLAYFRSQHQNQSWLAALTVVADSSAIVLLCSDDGLNRQAQLTFAICRHVLVDLSTVFRAKPEEPRPERISSRDLAEVISNLRAAQTCLRLERLSTAGLGRLRNQYESNANALSRHFLAALPEWIPNLEHSENWRTTAWNHPGGGFAVSDPFAS